MQVATDQVYLAFCAAKSLEQQQQGGNVGAGYKDKWLLANIDEYFRDLECYMLIYATSFF